MSSDPRPGARGGRVLVSVQTSEGQAGIVRGPEDDGYFLVPDLDHAGSQLIEEFEVAVIGGRVTTIVGGLLPEEVTEVAALRLSDDWVDARCDEGAWIVALEEPLVGTSDPLVLFRDGAGHVVAPPLPDGATRSPATRDKGCPACGQRTWEQVEYATYLPEWTAGIERATADAMPPEDNPLRNEHSYVRCATCGHRGSHWAAQAHGAAPPLSVSASPPTPDEDEVAGPPDVVLSAYFPTPPDEVVGRPDVRSVDFPTYGLDASWTGARYVSGWGQEEGQEITSVALLHEPTHGSSEPSIVVETKPFDGEDLIDEVRDRLWEIAAEGDPSPDFEDWFDERNVDLKAVRASARSVRIEIDALKAATFQILEIDSGWAAAGRVRESVVSIQVRGIYPPSEIRLVRVDLDEYDNPWAGLDSW